jgi:hypothetical protein
MTTLLLGLATVTAVVACWFYLRECNRRRADAAEQQARLQAALAGLRECLHANDVLCAAVSEREQTIGILLRRLNEANVALVATGQRKSRLPFTLGLPQLKVAPNQFNRN